MKIDKSQLNIIKSYVNPPFMVVLVLKACCSIFGFEESWESAKRYLLGDIRFLEKLVEFDVKTTPESRFLNYRKNYLGKEDFTREAVVK